MSDSKTRTDDAIQHDSARPSYAQLRDLAAKRAEARRGISRRDFVAAGVASAIAAATPRNLFAGESPRQAFDRCIAEMKKGAGEFSFEPKVLDALEKHGLPTFEAQIARWPDVKDRVIAASFAIGEISAALARLNDTGKKTIMYPQAKDAVEAVKRNCTVRWNVAPRGVFCPDLP